jgi:lipopolysaccharide export system protein LptA
VLEAVALVLCLTALPAAVARALESDREQAILVEADGVEINDRTGVSTYTGNVVIRQGSIRIEADRVTVHQKQAESDRVVAEGDPVRFQQQPDQGELIKGRARKAEYRVDSELLYLMGDAWLSQGSDSFASDRITYDRARALVKAGASAQGQQRVKVTIEPRGDSSGP